MLNPAQSIVKWEFGANGAHAPKLADLECNPDPEPSLFNLLMEVNHAQQPTRLDHATHNLAQLTVFYPHGPNGANAPRLAVQELPLEPEMLSQAPLMEERNVELPSKLKLATYNRAPSIALWEHGALGHLALFHVEVV